MKTISHVYDSYGQARAVVEDLEANGISHKDITLVANRYVSKAYEDATDTTGAATGAGVGAVAGGGAGLLAGLGLLAIPGLGPVVAAGWAAAAAVGAMAGAAGGVAVGGLVDILTTSGESEEYAHVYTEAVRRGATLVSARIANEEEDRVRAVFAKYDPIDPDVRIKEYRAAGWDRFDPKADPYRPSQTEIDRIRMRGHL
jgi:hypothetical protein